MKTLAQCAALVPWQAPDKRSEKKGRVYAAPGHQYSEKDSLDMHNLPEGGIGPQHDHHSEMRFVMTGCLYITKLPSGEQFFSYHIPIRDDFPALDSAITGPLDKDRVQRIWAAAITLVSLAGDEKTVNEIILGVARQIEGMQHE